LYRNKRKGNKVRLNMFMIQQNKKQDHNTRVRIDNESFGNVVKFEYVGQH